MASWKGYLTPFLPGSVNLVRRGSRRTVRKKYRSERKGRRSFDTRIQYDMANLMAIEKTRTAKAAVRATRLAVHALRLYNSSGFRKQGGKQ